VNEGQPIIPMNLVHQNGHRFLLSASHAELVSIANALNEVCNGVHIADTEFETRLGGSRDSLRSILASVSSFLSAEPASTFETVTAYTDGCSVQARCVAAYGDPVDMSSGEAREFARLLISCADQADSQ
jgi:hypothetical protein